MKKFWLFCFCLLVVSFFFIDLRNRAGVTKDLTGAISLMDANEPGWELSRLDFYPYNKDGSFFLVGRTDPKTDTAQVKTGYISDMNKKGLDRTTQKRLHQIFSLMKQHDIARIRKEQIGYIFFEQGGRVINKGHIYVYTSNESKWNPVLHRSKWFTKPYKFERINEHWFKARQ